MKQTWVFFVCLCIGGDFSVRVCCHMWINAKTKRSITVEGHDGEVGGEGHRGLSSDHNWLFGCPGQVPLLQSVNT